MVGTLSTITAIGTGIYPDLVSSGTLSAILAPVIPKAVNLTGGGVLGATTKQGIPGPLTGAGALTANVAQVYAKQAPLSGGGALIADFFGTGFKNMDIAGTGALSATWMGVGIVYPALAGAGTLTATTPLAKYLRNGLLAGNGTLSGATSQIYSSAVALSGDGVLSATNPQLYNLAPALSGSGTLSVTIDVPALVVVGAPVAVRGSATSILLPAHAPNDLILVLGAATAGTTMTAAAAGGTVPTWNTIDNTTSNPPSLLAYAVATASNHTSGTWSTPATMCAIVIRNAATGSPIGGHGKTQSQSTSTNITAPAITMAKTDGTSMLLHFFASRATAGNAAWPAAPAGYTQLLAQSPLPAYPEVKLAIDRKTDTTSDGVCTQSTGDSGNPSNAAGYTVEILRR